MSVLDNAIYTLYDWIYDKDTNTYREKKGAMEKLAREVGEKEEDAYASEVEALKYLKQSEEDMGGLVADGNVQGGVIGDALASMTKTRTLRSPSNAELDRLVEGLLEEAEARAEPEEEPGGGEVSGMLEAAAKEATRPRAASAATGSSTPGGRKSQGGKSQGRNSQKEKQTRGCCVSRPKGGGYKKKRKFNKTKRKKVVHHKNKKHKKTHRRKNKKNKKTKKR